MACLNRFSDTWGKDFAMLGLRLFTAYEFWESGVEKWKGENWFADIQDSFPFPINLLPVNVSWTMAMGAELIVPVLLVIGLFGRIGALSLMVVTAVAWVAVHGGNGYNVCDNGYKMALIYILVLLPQALQGMGRFSLDYLFFGRRAVKKCC
ncbi:MAG: DoxX family protein [Neisseria sp.]|uniref:HvfX family Cu-binding RiPP maturation protein n=1 Tax=Neisseria sp. TaxID=192066 RepID=UPI0026DC24CF|nr:DoxX family protein [Neisseria sp.]MDO4641019.1 DoxX family protein [Neisseria sp.]